MHCGFDFGTSNSALGCRRDGSLSLLPLEGESRTLPTALFYHAERPVVDLGRQALRSYLDGEDGRLMRSIKSVLGTSLMDETTRVGRRQVPFSVVLTDFIAEAKRRAEAHLQDDLTSIVQGRPVRFVDHDEAADRTAQETLEKILRSVGFRDIEFEFEPVAAACHYADQHAGLVSRERLALVVDIGGGTSDFSVVRLVPQKTGAESGTRADVLANTGVRLGGTDFDHALSFNTVMPLLGLGELVTDKAIPAPRWIYSQLSSWPRINTLYTPKAERDVRWLVESAPNSLPLRRLETVVQDRLGHRLAADVEAAKIALSEADTHALDLRYIDAGLTPSLLEADLRAVLADGMGRMDAGIVECLDQSALTADAIELVILTGGSTEMPVVQDAVRARLPEAVITPCDTFGAVASGLTVEAARRFG